MPNHVVNKLTFHGGDLAIQKILELITSSEVDNNGIDFNKIIPMPDNIFKGNLGPEEQKLYGNNNWYDWSVSNWGTKWNAYDQESDGDSLIFYTAWSMPYPIYQKLSELCERYQVTFDGGWCDEDWCSGNCGRFEGRDGQFFVSECETEEEMEQICKELWGEY